MVEINNITKVFNKDKIAVNNVSLNIKAGQIVGFVGPNGAGKTTTLKMMTGILKPDQGSIKINNFDIEKDPILAKKQFGYISDNPNSFLKLKGREYLQFIGDMYEVASDVRVERIKEYTTLLKMDDSLEDKIASYSHGMKQKIMIIAMLLSDPDLLILDEPLTGLDPQSSFILKELMRKRANENKTVFFSTHVLEVAEKLCDEIIIINHGEILYVGTLENLKQQYPDLSLEEIFMQVVS